MVEPVAKPRQRINATKLHDKSAGYRPKAAHNTIRSHRQRNANRLQAMQHELTTVNQQIEMIQSMPLAFQLERADLLVRLEDRKDHYQARVAQWTTSYAAWDDHYQWGGGDNWQNPHGNPPQL